MSEAPGPYAEWRDTPSAVHIGSRIAGRIGLALVPPIDHTWHMTLTVTARGSTTGSTPHGLDFLEAAGSTAADSGAWDRHAPEQR